MAVAFDAVTPDTSSGAGVTSLTSGSWTVGAGSNRVTIGVIGTGDVSGSNPTGMKWQGSGGTALTQHGSTLNIGTHGKLSVWRLIAPTAAASTAYGDWGSSQGEATIGMASYTGVDQTTPLGTSVTANWNTDAGGAASPSVNVTTAVGDTVFAVFFAHNTSSPTNPTITAAGGATTRYDVPGTAIGGFGAILCTELVAVGTTTTMSATVGTADLSLTNAGGVIAFVIKAATSMTWARYSGTIDNSVAAAGTSVLPGVITVAGDLIVATISWADNASAQVQSPPTISGSVLTWTQIIVTNFTTGNDDTKHCAWWAIVPDSTTRTVTFNHSSVAQTRRFHAIVHTNAHATNPVPTGNVFSGSNGSGVTQAITPTATGSALWMLAGDWAGTNSYGAAANCTLEDTLHDAGQATFALVRPSTQPKTDALAFTLGETDTAGNIAWIAFEVLAAGAVVPITSTVIAWIRA